MNRKVFQQTRWLVLLACVLSALAVPAEIQQPAEIRVAVVSTDFVLPGKIVRLQQLAAARGIVVQGYTLGPSAGSPQAWFDNADLVILDTPRGNDRAQVMEFVAATASKTSTPWLAVGGGEPQAEHLPPGIFRSLLGYYGAGGEANFRHMMAFIRAWKTGESTAAIPRPIPLPEAGYYHPQAPHLFATLDDYHSWGKGRWPDHAPVMAVAISSSSISNGETAAYDFLVATLEKAGAQPLVFWYQRGADNALLAQVAAANPVMLLNTTHMVGETLRQQLAQLNIPVVMGLSYRDGDVQQWRNAAQGMSASSAAALMMIPESWGMSDPLVLTAVEDGVPTVIPEQVDLLVGRFLAMARLRNSARDHLNIATLFWNSPGGERNLSASNLNVPRSIENILQGLQQNGYAVETADEQSLINTAQRLLSAYYHPEKLDALLKDGLAAKLPVRQYKAWLQSLPPAISRSLTETWGEPQTHWSVRTLEGEDHFVIPLQKLGKFALLPQPPRADRLGESTHDLVQPPGHFYLATYLYLREHFRADALIHLGTHGTQEWTPGKDRGLWAYDYPNLAVGNVPVFYPYIQDNIGEAMQAKRRGRATVISHQTPPFAPSGFYDELRDIHDLMHRYLQLESGVVRDETLSSMLSMVKAFNLHRDLGWSEQDILQRADAFVPVLHDHLHALAKTSTPIGLHTFGEPASLQYRTATVMQQLGNDYYQALDLDTTEIFAANFEDLFQEPAFQYLQPYLQGDKSPAEAESDALRQQMEKARAQHTALTDTHEMESLLRGLSGRFVPPGPGGDPVRNPSTTSGTNLYALDPNKIPTPEAYRAAESTYMALVDDYREKHSGQWPDKLAFSLWSSETIRTLGLSEAQIMRALGVRPVWDTGGRVTGLEIIPDEEMKTPRVDTLIQVTSVYRDQFDGIMKKLAVAIDALSQQTPDEKNPIAQNSQRLALALQEQGLSAPDAARYARARLFSNPPGDYGSGVTDMAMDSTAWDEDSVLADTFVQSQSHIYSAQDWGAPVAQLNLLESQLEGVDAVLLSRSSNVHGLLSTDHPYEYLGGLSAAVKKITGENPALYVSDARAKTATIENAASFLSSELRTRYQNPQWIQGMQAEGYAGTVQMLKVVNNLFGWQVMDSNMVRADQWQAMHETYVMDRRDLGLNAWFAEHNATAQAQIIERMMEAVRKGYWNASAETRQQLIERWKELVNELGADSGAQKTVDFIREQAAGFGISLNPAPETASVRGQILQQVEQQSPAPVIDRVFWLACLTLLASFAAGALRAYTNRQRFNHLKIYTTQLG